MHVHDPLRAFTSAMRVGGYVKKPDLGRLPICN
jgi:hypothetical protein